VTTVVRVGTRGSQLARTQSGHAAALIKGATGMPVELVTVHTEGDDLSVPLSAPSRPGAFVARLRDVLAAGDIDIAVHSCKDLPALPVDGLSIVAIPPRACAQDALIARDALSLADLPRGARVGTSSPRRAAALLRHRGDLQIVPIRGNVDTRIGYVRSGQVDAVVLAAAGVERLGRLDEISELIGIDVIVPAPAQGALAIEMRTDHPLAGLVTSIDDEATRVCVTAERQVLVGIDATCTTAIGAHAVLDGAELDGARLTLTAELTDHRGHTRVTQSLILDNNRLDAAGRLGSAVAAQLLEA
jgi:hydroxymethylbilane synthase